MHRKQYLQKRNRSIYIAVTVVLMLLSIVLSVILLSLKYKNNVYNVIARNYDSEVVDTQSQTEMSGFNDNAPMPDTEASNSSDKPADSNSDNGIAPIKTEEMLDFKWIQDINPSIGSITIENNGKQVNMEGNKSNAGKNAIYIMPASAQEQIFSFEYNIDYGDSFTAAGLLLKVKQENDHLKGYMLSFNNNKEGTDEKMSVLYYTESNKHLAAIWKFDYKLSDNFSPTITRQLVEELDIPKSGVLNVNSKQNEIIVKETKENKVNVTVLTDEYNTSYGFGFFTVHYSHSCSRKGSFNLKGMKLTTINILPHYLKINPNGGTYAGSSGITTKKGKCGDQEKIDKPVRNEYTFAGWTKDGTGGILNDQQNLYTWGENETDDTITAQWARIDIAKKSDITNGKVVAGQEITYTLTLTNKGTVKGTALVRDTIPTGTTFVANSITVNSVPKEYTQDNLKTGIAVTIEINQSVNVSFKVKVNDINNNDKITNKAHLVDNTVKTTQVDKDSNEVAITYVEPIISQTKSMTTAKGQNYVVQGETITYTIDIKNDGGLQKEVKIQDKVPTGTTFVTGSIKVDGEVYSINGAPATKEQLESGITINIKENCPSKKLSFEVTVNDNENKFMIKNTATVDGKVTNEVQKEYVEPIISQEKIITTEHNEKYVVEGETITYTIQVKNAGGLAKNVVIQDTIPTGTTFVEGSVKLDEKIVYKDENQTITQEDLKNGIEFEVPRYCEAKRLSFEVTVNDNENSTMIKNKALVDGTETNEVQKEYVEPIISQLKSMKTEYGNDYVVEGEKITYTIEVKNDGGIHKEVIIKDTIPDGTRFVEGSVKLNGKPYNMDEKDTPKEPSENGIEPDTQNKTDEPTVQQEPLEDDTEAETPINTDTDENNLTQEPSEGDTETDTPNDTDKKPITQEQLEKGVNVYIPEYCEPQKFSFEVIVNDNENSKKITNKASVDDIETNEVSIEYVEPIIGQTKSMETEYREDYVVKGEKITYIIEVKNDGGLNKTVKIQDKVPSGTTFVEGSVKLDGETVYKNGKQNITQEDLENGIEFNIPKYCNGKRLSFEVIVNDDNDKDIITNKAYIDNKETNEVSIEYVEPIISQAKVMETENGQDYVVQGEKITYTIEVKNDGGIHKEVVIKDKIPEETTFVEGSVKLNGEPYNINENDIAQEPLENITETDTQNNIDENAITQEQLESGVTVDIPKYCEPQKFSFEVIVNDNEDKDMIINKAVVDEEETNEVSIEYVEPIISQEKSMTTEFEKEYVIEGEKITYTIAIKNDGGINKEVTIKDAIPKGTTFVKESVKLNGETCNADGKYITQEQLENGIKVDIPKYCEPQKLSFEVTVDDDEDEDIITNKALVDDVETNEVSNRYVEPIISQMKKATTQYEQRYVASGEKITYYIVVRNSGGLEKEVTIKDKIPEGTTFVEGSIRIDDENKPKFTEKDLTTKGIKVIVPKKEEQTEDKNIETDDQTVYKDDETIYTDNENVESEGENTETNNEIVEPEVENKETNNEIVEPEDENIETENKTVETENEIVDTDDKTDSKTETSTDKKKYTPGEIILSFEVTVDPLKNDTDRKKIKNVATVDEVKTNEVAYEALPFNMKIEKTIEEINLNNKTQKISNNKLAKIEIPSKNLQNANLKIKYKIKVTNTGAIEGEATIQDIIPEGFYASDDNPSYWISKAKRSLETTTDTIKPGESISVESVITWQKGKNNIGTKDNTGKIVLTDNISKAPETTKNDNTDKASVIMSVKTGIKSEVKTLILIIFTSGIILVIGIAVIKKYVL